METPNRSDIVSRTTVLVILFHSSTLRPPLCIWPVFLYPKCLLNMLLHLNLGISSARSPWPQHAIYVLHPFPLPSHPNILPFREGCNPHAYSPKFWPTCFFWDHSLWPPHVPEYLHTSFKQTRMRMFLVGPLPARNIWAVWLKFSPPPKTIHKAHFQIPFSSCDSP